MLDQIKVLITGDGAKLTSALNTASGQIAAFGRKAQASLSQMSGQMKLLGTVAFAGITAGIKRTVDAYDDLYKASQKAGISVEALSKLRYAADLSGVEAQQLDTALKFLNKTLGEAAKGGEGAAEALAEVGVAASDDAATALNKIADAFQRMPDGAQKTALAVKLFGRAGTDLIPLLNAGSAGLKQFGDEADRLGKVVSTQAAKAAEELNDNMTRLAAALTGPFNLALQAVLPGLSEFSARLVAISQSAGGFATVLEDLGKRLGLGTLILQTRNKLDGLKNKLAELRAQEAAGDFPLFGGTGALYQDIADTEKAIERVEQSLVRLRERAGEVQKQTPAVDVMIEGAPNAAQQLSQDAAAAAATAQAAVPPIVVPIALGTAGAITNYADLKQEFLRQQEGMATGGAISGPGTSTSDSILARLSTGEYVVRASAVRAYGRGLLDAINAKRFNVGGVVGAPPGYASGGEVSFAIDFGGRRAGVARTSSTEADMISRMARRAAIQRAPR